MSCYHPSCDQPGQTVYVSDISLIRNVLVITREMVPVKRFGNVNNAVRFYRGNEQHPRLIPEEKNYAEIVIKYILEVIYVI